MRAANPTPELWGWDASAGTGGWPGPARILSTLPRPPQPSLGPESEATSQAVAEDLQRQRCSAGPPEGYTSLRRLQIEP
eukprot:7786529-Alexandrium_andersonii.AAC.1